MKTMPDREQNKLDPKLRMLANGSEEVNTLRAERSPAIAGVDPKILDTTPRLREPNASPDPIPEKVKWEVLDRPPDKVYVNVLIELKEGAGELDVSVLRPDPELPPPGLHG